MHKFMRGLISCLLVALILLQSDAAVAWGNEGHTYVNRVAAEKIPASMPRFLRRAVTQIAYLGPEPDRWRSPTEFALKKLARAGSTSLISSGSTGSIHFLADATSFIASSTRSAPRRRTTPTITFPNTSACSLTSRWRSTGD